jgi:hypothetical protein
MISPSRWRQRAIDRLSDPDYGRRFLEMRDIAELVEGAGGSGWAGQPGGEPSRNTYRFARELTVDRDLIKIQRDLYANLRARPVPSPEEAAHLLRRDAVVSLHTVLGQAGVLNNPTRTVYALYPYDEHPGGRRKVESLAPEGGVPAEFGVFVFFGVKRDYLSLGDPADRLMPVNFAKATPERALIDWFRLAQTAKVGLPSPPFDLDTDLLDRDRLFRLATAADLQGTLSTWFEAKAKIEDEGDDDYRLPGVGR